VRAFSRHARHANKGLTHAHILASFLLLIRPHARSRPTTGAVISESYALEYGTDALELHVGAITEGQRVLLVDDLIATGGTLAAGARLVRRAGGVAVEACCIIELPELGVRACVAACCVRGCAAHRECMRESGGMMWRVCVRVCLCVAA
jgi:adenine phosphoribosyltransferase